MKQITVKEALAQGYQHCGYSGQEWGMVMNISDLTEHDFKDGGRELVLASKEERHYSLDTVSFREMVAEHHNEDHACDTGDDTDEIYNIIMKVSFDDITAKLNEALSKYKYWDMTTIVLKQ